MSYSLSEVPVVPLTKLQHFNVVFGDARDSYIDRYGVSLLWEVHKLWPPGHRFKQYQLAQVALCLQHLKPVTRGMIVSAVLHWATNAGIQGVIVEGSTRNKFYIVTELSWARSEAQRWQQAQKQSIFQDTFEFAPSLGLGLKSISQDEIASHQAKIEEERKAQDKLYPTLPDPIVSTEEN